VNWTVTIRPKAKADLRRAHDWYEERCAGLGDEFLADHRRSPLCVWKPIPNVSRFTTVVFAASSPTAFPTKSFSASSDRDIIIFRILHGAQDHPVKDVTA
jgi:plasmid stabilization system protein ParE